MWLVFNNNSWIILVCNLYYLKYSSFCIQECYKEEYLDYFLLIVIPTTFFSNAFNLLLYSTSNSFSEDFKNFR